MVDYNPMGRLPQYEETIETAEQENRKLKRALTKIFYMVSNSNNLFDISRAVGQIRRELDWPFLDTAVNVLELAAKEEE